MIQEMMGIITNTTGEDLLRDIAQRCVSAIPFGGRYRLLDFALSNMVNAGIRNVGVVTTHKYRALMDHLGSGKHWGLDRKVDGLFILPSASPSVIKNNFKIDLRDLYTNLDYLEKSRQKYIAIYGNNLVCNVDLKNALSFHKENTSDITIFYKEEKDYEQDTEDLISLEIESNSRVKAIHKEKNTSKKILMEIVIVEKTLLVELIKMALLTGIWDLVDILKLNINNLKVYSYEHKGYLAKIHSVDSYFKHSMELLNTRIWNELFFNSGLIITKEKNGPPTKYCENSAVGNSLIASSCNIEGRVEDSIIFRGANIGSGAYIKNSIIMQKSDIGENVILENVILDKGVIIRKGKVLKGEKNNPIVIRKNSVI